MYHCKDTNEIAKNYTEYLKTEHWKNVKLRMMKSKYEYKCNCCSTKTLLQLHHKSYKRVDCEHLTDLIWLCSKCHKELHETYTSKNSLWSASRKLRKKKAKKVK